MRKESDLDMYIAEADSTNSLLSGLIGTMDLPEGFCLRTDFQTAGRGQQGNVWESKRGENLLFSMLLYPAHIAVQDQFILSQIVSIALKRVLDRYAESFSVKWPNDIYCHGHKIAGILIEHALQGSCLKHSIIGIGLNVNQTEFEGDFNAVSLREITERSHSLTDLLRAIRKEILTLYHQPNEADIRQEYMQSLYRREGFHPYADSDGIFYARIADVRPDGQLILEDRDSNMRGYYMKEVKVLF